MLFEEYSKIISNAIERICKEEREKLICASEYAADTIKKDGLIYVFGSGHSGILSCEGFYRAGGLACVAPIFHEPLMLHESASESSRLEKQIGYAEVLKSCYHLTTDDILICVSTSDKNAVAVEYADYITSSGVTTVAISSSAYFNQKVYNSCGKHLHEVCTLFIDNKAPFGDACLSLTKSETAMTPLSTVTGTFILNSILAEAAQLALKDGYDVPVYLSGNIPGGSEHNRALIERYKSRIPHL